MKTFNAPVIEIEKFAMIDILTASGEEGDPDELPGIRG